MKELIYKEDAINSIVHHKDLTWCYDSRTWAEELLEDADVIMPDRCDGCTDYEEEIMQEREAQKVSWQNEKRTGVNNENASFTMQRVRD